MSSSRRAAFNVDAYRDDVRDGHRSARSRAPVSNANRGAHLLCYGIKANVDWKKTLGSQWRQYESTFPRSRARPSTSFARSRNSKVPLELIGLLKGKD